MEYDVALSFADEDKEYVEAVAAALIQSGVRVYYHNFETFDSLQKDSHTHFYIYQKWAKYTVIFISKDYAEKLGANYFNQMDYALAFTESREFILPARFDDTSIKSIPSKTAYIDLRIYSPTEFCLIILEKIRNKLNSSSNESLLEKAESQNEGDLLDIFESISKLTDYEELKISIRLYGDVTILDLNGKLIMGQPIVTLRKITHVLMNENRKQIILNLQLVWYIDSGGLGILVRSYHDLYKIGGKLKLLNIESEKVFGALAISKMIRVFEVFTDETEAIESFK